MSEWDRKLAGIDKKLESIADDQLVGRVPATATPQEERVVVRERASTNSFGVFARLVLSVALGIGVIFWPYASRCGIGLAAYLFVVAVVIGSGVWSALWTFRHRAGRAHILSLLIVLWGMILGAGEILPRTGYAVPTLEHPASWSCQ